MKNTKKAILTIFALAALAPSVWAKKQKAKAEPAVEAANPFYSFKRLEDAEKKAGFKFNLLDVFESYTIQSYRVIPKQLFEAVYDSESGDEIRIRKAPGKNDPSGDFSVYKEQSSQTIGDTKVYFYANENKCGKTVWHNAGYSYSITSQDRMSVDKALKTATKIIEMNAAR